MSKLKDKPLKKCHTDSRKMIDDIHNEYVKDLKDDCLHKYYLDNGIILDEYYSDKSINKSSSNSGILTYFEVNKNEKENEKTNIINNYMKNVDENIINDKYTEYKYDKCDSCNINLNINEKCGYLECTNCGLIVDIIVNSDKNSYNDPPKEINYFSYKRINHFNEWLAQFQGKENTDIPDNVYYNIKNEIKKNINMDVKDITYNQVRDILKKLDYNKYYENIPYLINIISGKKTPKLTRGEEEILRSLFKEIQIPFMNNCPPTRKNFLSYSYVLHKFCQLLEYDNLLSYFPLLKSREKLQQQDDIWKNICKDLKWEYIPST
jgi:predicted RNA-binding Zn-ribbon protein involved in translation (DUF1610 family)